VGMVGDLGSSRSVVSATVYLRISSSLSIGNLMVAWPWPAPFFNYGVEALLKHIARQPTMTDMEAQMAAGAAFLGAF